MDRTKIFVLIKAHLIAFSKQKFASHVVEKMLEHGTDEQRREVMLQFAAKDVQGESALPVLIKDSFGNYVIREFLLSLHRD